MNDFAPVAEGIAAPLDAAPRVVRAACPHDCPDTCAIKVTVQDGRILRLQGDADHPPTHGALCTKVSRYAERVLHPDRLLQPLKRVGPKGRADSFVPVSWDEALADIAARLTAIALASGSESIVPYSYAGTMGMVQGEGMAQRFFNRLGASRLDRTICASAGGEALAATYGHKVGMHVEHFARSRLILIWGSNSIASNLHFWTYAQQAKRAGARLVCIDPRRSETAEKCHQHLAILPGTDGALALALLHELFAHADAGWIDRDYLDKYVDSWPLLRRQAEPWTAERAAAVCGIGADTIRELAREYATTAGTGIRLNYGMQRAHGGGNAVRLIALLPCVTGAWRHDGGGLLLSSSGWFAPALDVPAMERPDLLHASPLRGRPGRVVNMSTIGDDLLRDGDAGWGPRIEALMVYNSNPVAVAPESGKVVRGFSREDLFTVVLEQFQTDTADFADYVLPATTQLEHLDVHRSYGHTWALINQPAIAPRGQALPNSEIFRRLAAAMGFDEPCFRDDDEALARAAFKPEWVDFDRLQREGYVKLALPERPFAEGGFPTRSGKAQVDSPTLGLPDHVPNHESVQSTPELAARYPLAMISPPARHFLNSSFVNVASLRAAEGEPLLEMHPDDARARGIAEGDVVRVFNARGTYRCKVQVGSRARPGVVNGLGIWWRKFGLDGTNVNELTHQRLTDIGRAPSFYDCLVEVALERRQASVVAADA
jgi:anaerobic selenocysteine-containing dehydrogenase